MALSLTAGKARDEQSTHWLYWRRLVGDGQPHPHPEGAPRCRIGGRVPSGEGFPGKIKDEFAIPFATEDYRELLNLELDGVVSALPITTCLNTHWPRWTRAFM
jgi:hypothetical protein